ncbi:hypothetical protein SDJN02_11993, partial [Cucurbita argyrosperma subsp. argyrosperma]
MSGSKRATQTLSSSSSPGTCFFGEQRFGAAASNPRTPRPHHYEPGTAVGQTSRLSCDGASSFFFVEAQHEQPPISLIRQGLALTHAKLALYFRCPLPKGSNSGGFGYFEHQLVRLRGHLVVAILGDDDYYELGDAEEET